jgi:GTP-binding protein
MTRAVSKVADYPFTTLQPILGTLEGADRQLILADIPGIIEGASEGAGLGHDFLAHVERTKLLVHVLDLAPLDGSDPEANCAVDRARARKHDKRLARLPRILVLSKADLVPPEAVEAARARWQARFDAAAPPVEEWEAPDPLTRVPVDRDLQRHRARLDELKTELLRRVPAAARRGLEELAGAGDLAEHRVFPPRDRQGLAVEQLDDGALPRQRRAGRDALLARTTSRTRTRSPTSSTGSGRMGVLRALEAEGFEPGTTSRSPAVVFELD